MFRFILYLSNYSFAKYYVLYNHNNFGRGRGAGQEGAKTLQTYTQTGPSIIYRFFKMILYGINLLILLQSKIHSYKTIFTVRCGKGCCIGKTFGQISCALLQTNIFGIYFQICQIRWFAGCRSCNMKLQLIKGSLWLFFTNESRNVAWSGEIIQVFF